MSTRPLHVALVGAALILSAIAQVPIFADATKLSVQELHDQCSMGVRGSLNKIFCLEFVAAIARQAFRNGFALQTVRDRHADLITTSISSACPKSFVSNEAMVEAFNEWAGEHFEKWSTSAETGVMQAMHDTWPC